MKKLLFTIFLVFPLGLWAQNLPLYEQYLTHHTFLNPAVSGSLEHPSVIVSDRHQWIGVKDAPRSQILSADMRFDRHNAISAALYNQTKGALNTKGLQFAYAYRVPFSSDYTNKPKKPTLAFGITFSVHQFSINEQKLTTATPDPIIDGDIQRLFAPDASVGIYIHCPKFFAGLSATQLFRPNLKLYGENYGENRMERNYFLNAGYRFITPDKEFAFESSVLYQMNENFTQRIDINQKIYFRRNYRLTLSYRHELNQLQTRSLISLFAVRLSERLFAGYAYDFLLSSTPNFSSGSHEFMLRYNFLPPYKPREYRIPKF